MDEFGVLNWFSDLMVLIIGLALLTAIVVIAVVYVIDVSQTSHAIRRNYPVIGRFRYLFETMGEFLRQYFSQ